MSAFMNMGDLIPGVVTQNSRSAGETMNKVRDARAKIYEQMPSEYMERYPLTKIVMSKRGKPAKSSKVEWPMQALNDFSVTPLGFHTTWTGSAFSGDPAKTSGTTVLVNVSLADAQKCRAMEEIEFRHKAATGIQGTVQADIVSITENGANSYLTVTLLEADDDDVTDQTSLLHGSLVGMGVPEGSTLPPGRYVEPQWKDNRTQIFMEGLQVTGSELADVEVFDEDMYNRYFRQTHESFNEQVERAIKFGTYYAGTKTQLVGGFSKVCKRTKMGGLRWGHRNLGGNFLRIPEVTTFGGETFTGKSWASYGYPFLKVLMNQLCVKSGSKKRLLASHVVMQDIMDMFESMTNVTIGASYQDKWGFEVTEIRGLTSKLELQLDAGLSTNSAWHNTVFIVEPGKIEYRPRIGRDFTIIRSKKDLVAARLVENGYAFVDAIQEGMYADFTITYDDLDGMACIEGWGRDFAAA